MGIFNKSKSIVGRVVEQVGVYNRHLYVITTSSKDAEYRCGYVRVPKICKDMAVDMVYRNELSDDEVREHFSVDFVEYGESFIPGDSYYDGLVNNGISFRDYVIDGEALGLDMGYDGRYVWLGFECYKFDDNNTGVYDFDACVFYCKQLIKASIQFKKQRRE